MSLPPLVNNAPVDTQTGSDLGGSYELVHVDLPAHWGDARTGRAPHMGSLTLLITARYVRTGADIRQHLRQKKAPAVVTHPGARSTETPTTRRST
jgi:hypothetical protein